MYALFYNLTLEQYVVMFLVWLLERMQSGGQMRESGRGYIVQILWDWWILFRTTNSARYCPISSKLNCGRRTFMQNVDAIVVLTLNLCGVCSGYYKMRFCNNVDDIQVAFSVLPQHTGVPAHCFMCLSI